MKERDVTIYDLASKLNLSPATISRALNNHPRINHITKKKIVDLAASTGYRSNNFASNLRKQRTNTIGVIVPRLTTSFMSTVISGIENIANKEGYNLIISQSDETEKKEMANATTMYNNRVDGLLVSLAYNTQNLDHFSPFFKKNIPVVFFDRVPEHHFCTNIVIDNRKAGYEVTSHLISQGCKKIVHVSALQKRNVYTERFSGYRQALSDAGIEFKDDWLITGALSEEAGEIAAEIIHQMPEKPDGLFVANDTCAVHCMLSLMKMGYTIPQDIAVAGFNNDSLSVVIKPNLTTIDYQGYNLGIVAAQNLINHLTGHQTLELTNRIILRSQLLVRESSLRR